MDFIKKKENSFRHIAKLVDVDRKSVSKIWRQYSKLKEYLISSQGEISLLE